RAIDTSRKDIKDWRRAQSAAENFDNPVNIYLQNMYTKVFQDGLLTSQVENRMAKVFNVDFVLENANGETNEEQTTNLRNLVPWRELHKAIMETTYFEYNFGQFKWKKNVDGKDVLTWETL